MPNSSTITRNANDVNYKLISENIQSNKGEYLIYADRNLQFLLRSCEWMPLRNISFYIPE